MKLIKYEKKMYELTRKEAKKYRLKALTLESLSDALFCFENDDEQGMYLDLLYSHLYTDELLEMS